ncbi:MAG: ribonuclease P protein subunit [Methanomicrobiales archaeon]|nr:ribonuclease P protein subunit [Methanomicrobiales archaeon]
MITPQNILRHELTGLDVQVKQANNQYLEGIIGMVVEETRHMVLVKTNDRIRNIAKNGVTFRITLPSGTCVDVDGKALVMAPEKRINMRIKR